MVQCPPIHGGAALHRPHTVWRVQGSAGLRPAGLTCRPSVRLTQHFSNQQGSALRHYQSRLRPGGWLVSPRLTRVAAPANAAIRAMAPTSPVTVRFIIPEFHTSFGQQLAIVGSLPELGAWQAERAARMKWAPGHSWAVDIDVPADSLGGEYKVVLLDGASCIWEPGPNRTLQAPSGNSGTALEVVCAWGVAAKQNAVMVPDAPAPAAPPPQPPPSSPPQPPQQPVSASAPGDTVPCQLAVTLRTTKPGQRLVLVGSLPQLGAWQPAQGLKLAAAGELWQATTRLPLGESIQAKFVLVDENGGVEWEAGGNRSFTLDTPPGGVAPTTSLDTAGAAPTSLAGDGYLIMCRYNMPDFHQIVYRTMFESGDSQGGPPGPLDLTRCQFTVPRFDTQPGQQLMVVGSLPQLGAWNADKALGMTWQPGNAWVAQVDLPPEAQGEVKLVFLDKGKAVWEPGPNRQLDLPQLMASITGSAPAAAPADTASSDKPAQHTVMVDGQEYRVLGAQCFVSCQWGSADMPVLMVPNLQPVISSSNAADPDLKAVQEDAAADTHATESAARAAPVVEPTAAADPALVISSAVAAGLEVPAASAVQESSADTKEPAPADQGLVRFLSFLLTNKLVTAWPSGGDNNALGQAGAAQSTSATAAVTITTNGAAQVTERQVPNTSAAATVPVVQARSLEQAAAALEPPATASNGDSGQDGGASAVPEAGAGSTPTADPSNPSGTSNNIVTGPGARIAAGAAAVSAAAGAAVAMALGSTGAATVAGAGTAAAVVAGSGAMATGSAAVGGVAVAAAGVLAVGSWVADQTKRSQSRQSSPDGSQSGDEQLEVTAKSKEQLEEFAERYKKMQDEMENLQAQNSMLHSRLHGTQKQLASVEDELRQRGLVPDTASSSSNTVTVTPVSAESDLAEPAPAVLSASVDAMETGGVAGDDDAAAQPDAQLLNTGTIPTAEEPAAAPPPPAPAGNILSMLWGNKGAKAKPNEPTLKPKPKPSGAAANTALVQVQAELSKVKAAHQQEVTQLQAASQVQQSQLEARVQDLETALARAVSESQAKESTFSEQVLQTKAALREATAALAALEQQTAQELQAKEEAYKQVEVALQSRVSELEASVTDWQSRLAQAAAEALAAQEAAVKEAQQVAELNRQAEDLTTQISSMQQELQAAQARQAALLAEQQVLLADVEATYQAQLAAQSAQLQAAAAAQEELAVQAAQASEEIAALKGTVTEQQYQLEAEATRAQVAVAAATDLKQRYEQERSKALANATEIVPQLQAELERTKVLAEQEVAEQRMVFNAMLGDARQAASAERTRLERALQTLTASYEARAAQLRASAAADVQSVRDQAQVDLQQLTAQHASTAADLEAQLAEAQVLLEQEVKRMTQAKAASSAAAGVARQDFQQQAGLLRQEAEMKQVQAAARVAALQMQLFELRSEQTAALLAADAQHAEAIQVLRKEHELQLASVQREQEVLVAGLQQERLQLQEELGSLRVSHEQEVAQLRSSLQAESDKAVEELQKQHAEAMTALKAQLAAREQDVHASLEDASTQATAATLALQQQHEQQLSSLQAEHALAVQQLQDQLSSARDAGSALKADNELQVQQLRQQHQDEVARLSAEHTLQLEDAAKAAERKLDELKATLADDKQALEAQLAENDSALAVLRAQQEQQLDELAGKQLELTNTQEQQQHQQLAAHTAQVEALQVQLDSARSLAEQQVAELQAQAAADLATAAAQLTEAQEQAAKQLDELRLSHAAQINELLATHEQQRLQLVSSQEETVRQAVEAQKQVAEKELQQVKDAHAVEMEAVRREAGQAVDSATQQLSEVKAQHEQDLVAVLSSVRSVLVVPPSSIPPPKQDAEQVSVIKQLEAEITLDVLSLRGSLVQAEERVQQLQGALQDKDASVLELTRKLQQANAQVQPSTVQQAERAVASSNDQGAVQQQVVELMQQLAEEQAARSALATATSTGQNAVDVLRQQLSGALAQSSRQLKAAQQAETALLALRAKYDGLCSEQDVLVAKAQQAEAARQAAEEEAEAQKAALDQVKKELHKQTKALATANGADALAQPAYQSRSRQVDQAAMQAESEKRIAVLEADLADMRTKLEQAQREKQELSVAAAGAAGIGGVDAATQDQQVSAGVDKASASQIKSLLLRVKELEEEVLQVRQTELERHQADVARLTSEYEAQLDAVRLSRDEDVKAAVAAAQQEAQVLQSRVDELEDQLIDIKMSMKQSLGLILPPSPPASPKPPAQSTTSKGGERPSIRRALWGIFGGRTDDSGKGPVDEAVDSAGLVGSARADADQVTAQLGSPKDAKVPQTEEAATPSPAAGGPATKPAGEAIK